MRVSVLNAVFCACLIVLTTNLVQAQEIKVGTGGKTGVYYATGKAICDLINPTGVICEALSTKGSVANLKSLAAGEIDFAMVQSDWQFHAYQGSSEWDGAAMPMLRSVFSVYAEPLQIVVKRDAGIRRFRDLRGKRINIGNEGSGQRKTFGQVLETERWKLDVFSEVFELPSSEQIDAFCENKFDAFVFTVGVPNAAMQRAVAECNGMLLEPDRTAIRKMATAARPYYARARIPAGTYWENQERVDTFGVVATLVTREDVSSEKVEAVIQAVFNNMDAFRDKHPAFAETTAEFMVNEGLSAPFHPVAQAYFDANNWIK